jgi:uncharacterized protein with beta-barrel porin domain
MRPATLRLLLSTTSVAALAALAGTAVVDNPALAVSVNADTTITVSTTDQQSLDTAGVDLVVTNAASVNVSTGAAVIMNKASTTLTVGVVSGSPNGVGLINGLSLNTAVQVNSFTGMAITTNANGVIQSDATQTIGVANSAGVAITNRGAISNIGVVSGNAAISLTNMTGSILNTRLNVVDTAPGITSLSGAAIAVGGTLTGGIVNDGSITSANKNGYVAGTINLSGAVTLGITNNATGTIQAGTSGQAIQFVNSSANASITNSGTIQQVDAGAAGTAIVYLAGASPTSSIVNSGTISSTGTGTSSGAIVYGSGAAVTGSISNSNLITASGLGASAISFADSSSLSGGITNKAGGTISATGTAAAAISIIGGSGAAATVANITNNAASGVTPAGHIGSTSTSSTGTIVINTAGTKNAQSLISNAGLIDVAGTGDAIKIGGGIGAGANVVSVNNAAGGIISATNGTSAAAHAVNFASATSAVGSTAVLDNAGSITGNKGATVLVSGALTPGGGQFGIANRATGLISTSSNLVAALDIQAAVGGGIDNAGTISGPVTAIASLTGLTNTITNEATGDINGSVSIAQGIFNIRGGSVDGATTGENKSTVNFNTAAVSTVSYSSFDPIFDTRGFTTGGAMTLTQGNSSSINVQQGAIGVDHNLQADTVNINAGGILVWNASQNAGSRTIAGNLTNNGELAIVASPGGAFTGNVTGNIVSSGTGSSGEGNILVFGLMHDNGAMFAPRIAATGTGNLDTSTRIRVYNDYAGYTPAGNTVVLTTNGALTVASATDTNNTTIPVDPNSGTAVLSYSARTTADGLTGTGRSVTLTTTRYGYDLIGGEVGTNERNIGAALESIGQGGSTPSMDSLFGYLDSQSSETPIKDALHRMLPIANGAALYGSALGINSLLQSVDARLANFGDQYVDATPGFAGRTSGRASGLSGAANGKLNGAWMRVSGGTGSQGDIHNASGQVDGFGFNSWGVTIGADREVRDNLRIGVSFAYASTRVNGDDVENSKLDIQSYQVAGYGAWRSGPWFVTGVAGFGGNSYDGERTVSFGPFFGKPVADYGGWSFTAKAVAGMEMYPAWAGGMASEIQITPYGTLRYSHIHIGEYTEKDGGIFNLKVGSQGYDQFAPGLGVRIAKPFKAGNVAFLPWIRPEIAFDLVGDRQSINAAFAVAPGSEFVTDGIKPAQTVFNLGFGVNFFNLGPLSASLAGEYQTGIGQSYSNFSGFGQLRFQF